MSSAAVPERQRRARPKLPRNAKLLVGVAIWLAVILYPLWDERVREVTDFAPSVDTGVKIMVFTMMALGLNIVVGYAGLLDLGYVAFYAAGAYVAGWFASGHFAQKKWHFGSIDRAPTFPGIHVNPWLLLIAAGLFAALLGVLIGLPTLRLRGDYLAIVTLGFGEIIPQFVRNADSLRGFNLTNGPNGLLPLDPFGFAPVGDGIGLPANFLKEPDPQRWFYWVGLAFVGLTILVSLMLRDSRLGRAWVAIREDEIAASAMGVPLMQIKTLAYAIGALIGGVAGCYYALYKKGTFPQDFYLQISIFVLLMVILGGMGNVWGVCFGAAFLAYLNFEGLARVGREFNSAFGTKIDVPKYEFLIFGVIIVAVMLFRPQGLMPERRRADEFIEAELEAQS